MSTTANGTDAVHDTPTYYDADSAEKGRSIKHLDRVVTPGGHPVDFSQPSIPVQHRKFGNPLPAGLFSFAMGFFLVGLYTLQVRGVKSAAAAFPTFIMFLGVTQTLVGWFEMFIGNTFSATIFICYGGFLFSYTMVFIPAFGVLPNYTVDGVVTDELNQALGLMLCTWAIITFLFILAALRSSVAILGTLFFTMMSFMCMAIQAFTSKDGARIAAGSMQVIAACFGFWAGLSGYWTPDVTYAFIRAPPIALSKED